MYTVVRTPNTLIAAPVTKPLPVKEGSSAARVRRLFPELFGGWTRTPAARRVVAMLPLIG